MTLVSRVGTIEIRVAEVVEATQQSRRQRLWGLCGWLLIYETPPLSVNLICQGVHISDLTPIEPQGAARGLGPAHTKLQAQVFTNRAGGLR